MTIWKFPLPVEDLVTVLMPQGARLLELMVQRDTPTIWALVDPNRPVEPRTFRVVGTGHPCNEVAIEAHVGSYQLMGGALVFHVFEMTTWPKPIPA